MKLFRDDCRSRAPGDRALGGAIAEALPRARDSLLGLQREGRSESCHYNSSMRIFPPPTPSIRTRNKCAKSSSYLSVFLDDSGHELVGIVAAYRHLELPL